MANDLKIIVATNFKDASGFISNLKKCNKLEFEQVIVSIYVNLLAINHTLAYCLLLSVFEDSTRVR